jgi:amidase
MKRRDFLGHTGVASLTLGLAGSTRAAEAPAPAADEARLAASIDVVEKSFTELASASAAGSVSSAALTLAYLARIDKFDRQGPTLRSVIATNPDALAIARSLDAERRAGRVRGPLHGLPILVKDNIETRDPLPTTAGSLALATAHHDADAPLAARLRAAGAVVLGKANMSEWANFRSVHSVSGWSGVGGQTRNPYDVRRNPSGSSAGPAAAAAASLCAGAIGTETDGSVLAPASICGLVGMKPTLGLVSGVGVVPISPRQDTAGPMTRTVTDAALLLGAIAERPLDRPATPASLDAFRATGLRVGLLEPSPSAHLEVVRAWQDWRRVLAGEGATLVDVTPPKSLATVADDEFGVLLWEFKDAINAYLGRVRGRVQVNTLADLIEFNRRHASEEMPLFGQDLFEQAEAKGDLRSPAYLKARAGLDRAAGRDGLAALFSRFKVDVLMAPGNGPAELIEPVWGDHYENSGGWPAIGSAAAIAGYPSLTVPAGFVRDLPVGVIFVAPRERDGFLLHVGHAYERATRARRAPTYRSA